MLKLYFALSVDLQWIIQYHNHFLSMHVIIVCNHFPQSSEVIFFIYLYSITIASVIQLGQASLNPPDLFSKWRNFKVGGGTPAFQAGVPEKLKFPPLQAQVWGFKLARPSCMSEYYITISTMFIVYLSPCSGSILYGVVWWWWREGQGHGGCSTGHCPDTGKLSPPLISPTWLLTAHAASHSRFWFCRFLDLRFTYLMCRVEA